MSITVYRAREVVTLDRNCPLATALAVRDGRILHVGSFEEVTQALADTAYDVDDRYGNRVLVPGFIEAHGHLFSDGVLGQLVWTGFDDRQRADGSTAKGSQTFDDVIERLRERALDSNDLVVGYGFDPVFHDGRPLTREDLDKVSTERGVLVVNASGHLAYANSFQMEKGGVDASTDEKGVVKDANGVPTGEFHETAMRLVLDVANTFGADPATAVRNGAELLRRAGVTTGTDLALFAAGPAFDIFAALASEPTFPVRVTYSPHLGDMARTFEGGALLEHLKVLRAASNERFASTLETHRGRIHSRLHRKFEVARVLRRRGERLLNSR